MRKKVKTIYSSIGHLFKKNKITLLNRYVPKIIPSPIGNRNRKLFLGFLKQHPIAFKHFSYKSKIMSRALPLNPGIILKIPTKIPFMKFIILNYMNKIKYYDKRRVCLFFYSSFIFSK